MTKILGLLKKISVPSQLYLLGIISASIASADAATATLRWNGNPNSLAQSFRNALNEAGNGGTIVLPPRTYRTNREILIDRRVFIRGGNRNNTRIRATTNGNRLFNIAANGVTFQNIELDGQNRVNNVINNFRRSGLRVQNSRVQNAVRYNIGNADFYPNRRLRVIGSIIRNGRFGIGILNRNNTVTRAENIEKFEIINTTIEGFGFTAVEIDCANDLGGFTTNFNRSIVRDCTMNGPGNFCVGATQSRALTFENNTLTCRHDPAHFEFRSRDILVRRNRLRTTSNGSFAGVALIPGDRILGPSNGNTPTGNGFRNPTPNDHANGCRSIRVMGNTFLGSAQWGVLSVEAADCRIQFNNFRNLNVRNNRGSIILLTDGDGSRSGFNGSNASRGSRRFTINNNSGLSRSQIEFQNGVGHSINQ